MRTVILTPFRSSPVRAPLWKWVQGWIGDHYDFPVFAADCDGVPFRSGAARNAAARLAGDWDVALVHDADTIAHPDAVAEAVRLAAESPRMVVAGDSHMYCDAVSSARIMASGSPAFARPASFDDRSVYAKPCSGVFAVSRSTWDRVGGYVESLAGWGYEDLTFLQCCSLFAGGHTWVPGHITLHLWHPPESRDSDTARNQHVWKMLANYRRLGVPQQARQYLRSLGHRVPA